MREFCWKNNNADDKKKNYAGEKNANSDTVESDRLHACGWPLL
jgi:hypothetical protein